MPLIAALALTLLGSPARAFLVDNGPLRERAIVNRCVAALLAPVTRTAEAKALAATVRQFFAGVLPAEDHRGLPSGAGYTDALPARWRWLQAHNRLGITLRDQRLQRLATDLADERVPKRIRVYEGSEEISEYIVSLGQRASALDERLSPLLRSDFRLRPTLWSALRLSLVGAGVGALTAVGWPMASLAVATLGAFDAGHLFLRARYAVGKALRRGREPADARTRRLDAGLARVIKSLERAPNNMNYRRHFGVTSFLSDEMAAFVRSGRPIEEISQEAFERLVDLRHRTPSPGQVIGDYLTPISSDWLFLPGTSAAETRLIVIDRLFERGSAGPETGAPPAREPPPAPKPPPAPEPPPAPPTAPPKPPAPAPAPVSPDQPGPRPKPKSFTASRRVPVKNVLENAE